MFTPFSVASFIIDHLLQPMLHITHRWLQFADITNPLLSTATLLSRFYIQETWAIKAALYLAKQIIMFHMQYTIETGSNCSFTR